MNTERRHSGSSQTQRPFVEDQEREGKHKEFQDKDWEQKNISKDDSKPREQGISGDKTRDQGSSSEKHQNIGKDIKGKDSKETGIKEKDTLGKDGLEKNRGKNESKECCDFKGTDSCTHEKLQGKKDVEKPASNLQKNLKGKSEGSFKGSKDFSGDEGLQRQHVSSDVVSEQQDIPFKKNEDIRSKNDKSPKKESNPPHKEGEREGNSKKDQKLGLGENLDKQDKPKQSKDIKGDQKDTSESLTKPSQFPEELSVNKNVSEREGEGPINERPIGEGSGIEGQEFPRDLEKGNESEDKDSKKGKLNENFKEEKNKNPEKNPGKNLEKNPGKDLEKNSGKDLEKNSDKSIDRNVDKSTEENRNEDSHEKQTQSLEKQGNAWNGDSASELKKNDNSKEKSQNFQEGKETQDSKIENTQFKNTPEGEEQRHTLGTGRDNEFQNKHRSKEGQSKEDRAEEDRTHKILSGQEEVKHMFGEQRKVGPSEHKDLQDRGQEINQRELSQNKST